jgi:ferrous iron transport protein A
MVVEKILKLTELKPGQTGTICEFRDSDIFIKLMEMGCVPGEQILVEQIAPMGGPISVTVSGYRLSLRLTEAENILVKIKH